MKKPRVQSINNPDMLNKAMALEMKGRLAVAKNQLTYLKVDDAWIHELYPYLHNYKILKPNYFDTKESVGAHISIIYPEENTNVDSHDLDQEHCFKIKNIAKATIGLKNYFVLMIEAPSLITLRKKHGLPESLNFKGYSINFHITVGFK